MAGGGHYKGSSSGSRGRPYGVMLLLAFGAALLGVMFLHKLRERRIFNLLLKDKDRELISVQLLLQKERECTKEMKRKAEEMKAKIYSLRNQKMELDRRLLEMQSTIDSLKDEQKTIESALEEKQNEIKMLREKDTDSVNESLQLITLTESLKRKEAELEDLKHRLEHPANKAWSAFANDPSNSPGNLTVTGNVTEEKTELSESKKDKGQVSESTNSREEENRTSVEDGTDKKVPATDGINMVGGQVQKLETNLQEGFVNGGAGGEMKNDDSQNTVTSGSRGERNNENATEANIDEGGQEQKTNLSEELRKVKDSEGGENQEFQAATKVRGMKMEWQDDSGNGAGPRLKAKHNHLSRSKGKRWRVLARNRLLGKNVNSEMDAAANGRRFFKEDRGGAQGREEGAFSDKRHGIGEERDGDGNKPLEVRKVMDSTIVKDRVIYADANHQVQDENATLKVDEVKQPKEAANRFQQSMDSRDIKDLEKNAEEVKVSSEFAHKQEPETEAADSDRFGNLTSDFEEDRKEYKKDTDESEF